MNGERTLGDHNGGPEPLHLLRVLGIHVVTAQSWGYRVFSPSLAPAFVSVLLWRSGLTMEKDLGGGERNTVTDMSFKRHLHAMVSCFFHEQIIDMFSRSTLIPRHLARVTMVLCCQKR